MDGKYLLSTSDPDLSAEDVALGYKNLLEAGFRDLKSTIELRPVSHRIEPRIRAHVLLCWLALLLIRLAERRTGQTKQWAFTWATPTPSSAPPPVPSSRPASPGDQTQHDLGVCPRRAGHWRAYRRGA